MTKHEAKNNAAERTLGCVRSALRRVRVSASFLSINGCFLFCFFFLMQFLSIMKATAMLLPQAQHSYTVFHLILICSLFLTGVGPMNLSPGTAERTATYTTARMATDDTTHQLVTPEYLCAWSMFMLLLFGVILFI